PLGGHEVVVLVPRADDPDIRATGAGEVHDPRLGEQPLDDDHETRSDEDEERRARTATRRLLLGEGLETGAPRARRAPWRHLGRAARGGGGDDGGGGRGGGTGLPGRDLWPGGGWWSRLLEGREHMSPAAPPRRPPGRSHGVI